MSSGGSFNKFSSYLIGDLLSISKSDLFFLTFIFVVVIILWAVLFNNLLIISINQSFAKSRGISTFKIESIFASMLAVIVAVSIQWVGILIINSLLVLPAAASRNFAHDVKHYHFFSVAIALFSGLSGLFIAWHFNSAGGASIVLVAASVYFISLIFKSR